jgi:hypothetical protein
LSTRCRTLIARQPVAIHRSHANTAKAIDLSRGSHRFNESSSSLSEITISWARMDDSTPPPPDHDVSPPPPPPPPALSGSPTDFLKGVVGKRVIVRLTSGVDYHGTFVILEQLSL